MKRFKSSFLVMLANAMASFILPLGISNATSAAPGKVDKTTAKADYPRNLKACNPGC